MRLMIDNLDGQGSVDWSEALAPEGPITIERRMNAPSTCRWNLRDAAVRPKRLARAVITSDTGEVLFTGYLAHEPTAAAIGAGPSGAVYLLEMEAISDEWLLDKQGLRVGSGSFSIGADAMLRSLTDRVDAGRLEVATAGTLLQIGSLATTPRKSWSENAAAIANAVGASYRVLAGELLLTPNGAVTHTLSVADDSLTESGLRLTQRRPLVNDVTLSGEMEGGSYVTEIFLGDGTTSDFTLSQVPFAGGSSAERLLVSDRFLAALDGERWGGGDPGSHLRTGAGGLVMSGGNGLDGQTTLIATSAVELGGVLLLQAEGVTLSQGSDGVLLGLYSGTVSRTNCVAGFDVRQVNGTTTVSCLVNGATAGSSASIATGHMYRMQIFLHAAETQRVRQSYVTLAKGVPQQFGGGLVDSPLDLVFALEDLGVSSNTPTAVLFDGSSGSSPASVLFAPINSVQLMGSVANLLAERLPDVWVRGTATGGATMTRLPGATGTGADYALAAGGTLRYFAGRVPAAGEMVKVQYRTAQRAVARAQSADSVAAEASGGLPGLAVWSGSVLEPKARSSEDCAAAAQALLSVAAVREEALEGRYEEDNLPNVSPGDRMQFVTATDTYVVTVREVKLCDRLAAPELVHWELEMANDWGVCASIRVSHSAATDAAEVAPGYGESLLPSVAGLQVISVGKSAIQIDGGVAPPAGGGFEVRRSESFGPGTDGDLVLRTAVRGFTIPRRAQVERFFVRMYDGSTPPLYTRLSAVIVVNVPVS